MIYLIGGVSKSGKTYISNKILRNSNIPVFQTDFLLWSLGGKDGLFNYNEKDKIVAPILEPYIMKIISFLIKNNESYIIEGTHITPELCLKLKDMYKSNIKACFMGYANVSKEYKFQEILKYDNEIQNKWYKELSNEDFLKFLEEKIVESNTLKAICDKYQLKYFDVYDINKVENDIISFIVGM